MSSQETETPAAFVSAVEAYLGITFAYDMAASGDNKKAPMFFTEEQDSLAWDWPKDGWCWLNPPFRDLTSWVLKCDQQRQRGCKIVSIWPLSGDMNQLLTWQGAKVIILHGRIWPLVRGCMLSIWRSKEFFVPPVSGAIWDKKKGVLTPAWCRND